MKLVDNWKSAWKWFSVQLAVVAAAGEVILLKPSLREWLSDTQQHWVGAAIILCIVAVRLIDQNKTA